MFSRGHLGVQRFQQLRKAKRQTVVDGRFQRMFSDPQFNVIDGACDAGAWRWHVVDTV